jgi:hypothetical protein
LMKIWVDEQGWWISFMILIFCFFLFWLWWFSAEAGNFSCPQFWFFSWYIPKDLLNFWTKNCFREPNSEFGQQRTCSMQKVVWNGKLTLDNKKNDFWIN